MEDEVRMYRFNGVAHVAKNIDQEELFGELPPLNKVKQMTVHFTWFHESFRVLSGDASEVTGRIYARAYIMILLSSQFFGDKNVNLVHLCWLLFLASMHDLGKYSWGLAALASLYRCMCRTTNRNIVNLVGPLQLLQSWIFLRFPTLRLSGFNVFGFLLASRFSTLKLSGFNVFGFPLASRVDSVIQVDRVDYTGPSGEYLDWWYRVAHKLLSPDAAFHAPRPMVVSEEALRRGSS
ncbi:hypothetical protein Ahy_A09g043423 [Arachis hypogaea]|uniref:Aminotransferase-like plant mobile domain-containing protein n=1 Tax=Arachis hypogaea TaxID=3818 RepID=A0A445BI75_ARAHY|nr:hypothetical protein Ahy_A09g043423 [Arachis hypogaea]